LNGYKKIIANGKMISDYLVEVFLNTYGKEPERIVLDLDATDDPLHGRQEGRFFHGYYDCYCLLPAAVHFLRGSAVVGEAQAVEHRRKRGSVGRGPTDRGDDPGAVA